MPGSFEAQPTSALRMASMPDSSCATIGVTCSNEPLRAVLTSSAHARATESAPTIATLPCSEWAARKSASRSPLAAALRTASICPELSPMSESMSCATSPRDPRASRPRRWRVTSPAGSEGFGWTRFSFFVFRFYLPLAVCRRSSVSLQKPTSCSAVRSDANSSVSCNVWRSQSRTTFSYS